MSVLGDDCRGGEGLSQEDSRTSGVAGIHVRPPGLATERRSGLQSNVWSSWLGRARWGTSGCSHDEAADVVTADRALQNLHPATADDFFADGGDARGHPWDYLVSRSVDHYH